MTLPVSIEKLMPTFFMLSLMRVVIFKVHVSIQEEAL